MILDWVEVKEPVLVSVVSRTAVDEDLRVVSVGESTELDLVL